MAKFWELFESSIIVQSLITLMLVGAVTFMYVTGREVPDNLVNMALLVLGFWFGTKIQGNVNRTMTAKVIRKELEDGRPTGR